MAEPIKVDRVQLMKLSNSLRKAGISYDRGKKMLLKRIGKMVQGVARDYCPESPTIGMYAKMNKSGKTKRKRTGITSGSLRDSIQHHEDKNATHIYVPANSRGGAYAEKIHDEKGKSWKKRGPRTVQKGAKADAKFIDRAYADNSRNVDRMVDDVIDALVRKI
jgi:hypothetical protein